MEIYSVEKQGWDAIHDRFNRISSPSTAVLETVRDVLSNVRLRGDIAVLEYTERFDGAALPAAALQVTDDELRAAAEATPADLVETLKISHGNISSFAARGLRQDWSMTNSEGAEVGERFQPFERVGIYVPGGSAPLVSTALMTVTLAAAAGCPEIVVCTPPDREGEIQAPLLHALDLAGATEILKIGGAQAMAAMAYGTETIKPVVKVFGPGNKFVVEAKRQLFGQVAVDLLPGPSEIMTLTDDSGVPSFIAADLLAQAEHGADGQVALVTPSPELLKTVQKEIKGQMKKLARQEQLKAAIDEGCSLIHVPDLDSGVDLVNAWAPEHLSLCVDKPDEWLPRIRTAGAIYVGNWSAVAVGDFIAGPSHELPTGGAGKSFAGLTVDQFQRRTSVVRMDRSALEKAAPHVARFTAMEGLDAHGASVSIRRATSED